MKTSVIVTAALVVAASAAPACNITALTNNPNFSTLVAPAFACQTAANYTFIPPSALPTSDQVMAVCSKCSDLLKAAADVAIPDCDFGLNGSDISINIKSFFANTTKQCQNMSSTGATGSNKTSAPTPAPTPKSAAATASVTVAVITAVAFSVAALLA